MSLGGKLLLCSPWIRPCLRLCQRRANWSRCRSSSKAEETDRLSVCLYKLSSLERGGWELAVALMTKKIARHGMSAVNNTRRRF